MYSNFVNDDLEDLARELADIERILHHMTLRVNSLYEAMYAMDSKYTLTLKKPDLEVFPYSLKLKKPDLEQIVQNTKERVEDLEIDRKEEDDEES